MFKDTGCQSWKKISFFSKISKTTLVVDDTLYMFRRQKFIFWNFKICFLLLHQSY